MKKRRKRDRSIDRRIVQDPHVSEYALAVAIRSIRTYEIVSALLTYDYICNSLGEAYAAVWEVVRDFYDTYRSLPPRERITSNLHQKLTDNPNALGDDPELASEFLKTAFTRIKLTDAVIESAIYDIRCWAEEQAQLTYTENTLVDGTVPTDALGNAQQLVQKLGEARSLTDPSIKAFDWSVKLPTLIPTGLPCLDRLINGGQAEGEVYVFLAPTGTCKSLVAVQGTYEAARLVARTYDKSRNGEFPVVVFISSELAQADFCQRLDVCASWIKPAELKGLGRTQRQRLAARSKNVARGLIDRYVKFMDMNERHGACDIQEIAAALKAETRLRSGTRVTAIWIDHADDLVKLMIERDKRYTTEDRSGLLDVFVNQCKHHLAVPFKCPVWIMHQLAGSTQRSSPTARLHHSDAAWCKSFANNSTFAIVTGNTDPDQLMVWRSTKHRRGPARETIVKIFGEGACVLDVSTKYFVDEGSHRILERNQFGSKATDQDAQDFASKHTSDGSEVSG